MSTNPAEVRHSTALKWFEIHASQRMQLLAGYLAAMGFISGGIGGALSAKLPLVVTALGLLLATLTAVFDKLDDRTKQLVKVSETALAWSLEEIDPSYGRDDIVALSEKKGDTPSYRDSFLVLYAASYVFAFGSILIAWLFLK